MTGDVGDRDDERAPSGHAEHFLARLERVQAPEMELALSLYRDSALVRAVLAHANLSDGVDRVAFALADGDRPPHAIVTRDGAFVTCLGAGMSTGACPVIARERIGAIAERVHDQRSRMREFDERDKRSRRDGFLSRIFHAGDAMSREEFVALSAWAPLAATSFLRHLVEATQILLDAELAVARVRRPKPRDQPALRIYWEELWAMGHLAALLGMGARELFDKLGDIHEPSLVGLWLPAIARDMPGVTLRALWAVGQLGKVFVGPYRRALAAAEHPMEQHALLSGLAVIAGRHAKLRGEASKAIAGKPAYPPTADSADLAERHARFATFFAKVSGEPDELIDLLGQIGAVLVVHDTSGLPEGHPQRFDEPDAVPRDLACARAASYQPGELDDVEPNVITAFALPWLARVDVEALYLPEAYLRAVGRRGFSLDDAMASIEHNRVAGETARRDAPKPGRNAPCPCGSGKKWKRCCGAG